MNKDQVEGKVKDTAGRIERQVGEWTGDAGKQVHGAAKQAEGKVQNAWGDVKDAAKSTDKRADRPSDENLEKEQDDDHTRRKAS